MGDVSDTRKQILQNTLTNELKKHFRIVPQEKYEQVLEQVFEELEYEECSEDTCIMRVQEMLQVENVFNLQIIGEGNDSQLNLKWITLDEKKNVEDYCEGCGTRDLRKMIGGLVEKLVEENEIESVVLVKRNESEIKKKQADVLKKKEEDKLRKKEEEELKERKKLYFKTRKLSIVGLWDCRIVLEMTLENTDDSSSTTIDTITYLGTFNLETKYHFNEKLSVSVEHCNGPTKSIFTIVDGERREDVGVKILSGRSEFNSILLNYSWNFDSSSIYAGGGITSHSSKLEYQDYISNLNHSLSHNSTDPSLFLGYQYIFFIGDENIILDIKYLQTRTQQSVEITNSTKKYKTNYSSVFSLIRLGSSF